MAEGAWTIAVDANVLINFIHIGQLDHLARLPGLAAVVPAEVVAEIRDPTQARVLRSALEARTLLEAKVSGTQELNAYAELTRQLGKGESACLTVASVRGWCLASDEKGPFRRITSDKLGQARLFTTPDLILQLIGANVTTISEADQWKARLAERRFRMKFESFAEFF